MRTYEITAYGLEGWHIRDRTPTELRDEDWSHIQTLSHWALYNALKPSGYTYDDVAHLVQKDDPEHFKLTHINPNKSVESGEFLPDQALTNPRVITAHSPNHSLDGYMYVVGSNISGKPWERTVKKHAPIWMPKFGNRDYFKVQEVMVRPEYWRKGFAREMGKVALGHAKTDKQFATTYVYSEDETAMLAARTVGFSNPLPVENTNPELVRMNATVGDLRRKVLFGI